VASKVHYNLLNFSTSTISSSRHIFCSLSHETKKEGMKDRLKKRGGRKKTFLCNLAVMNKTWQMVSRLFFTLHTKSINHGDHAIQGVYKLWQITCCDYSSKSHSWHECLYFNLLSTKQTVITMDGLVLLTGSLIACLRKGLQRRSQQNCTVALGTGRNLTWHKWFCPTEHRVLS
jgi:hypothetical protein